MTKKCLADKVAIITGGGRGLGRAFAEVFAQEGAKIVVVSRTKREIDEVAGEISRRGGKAIAVQADVRDEFEVREMVRRTISTFSKIDILVNNAGMMGPLGPITEIRKEDWEEVLGVNVTGMFLCSREVLRYMILQNSGNIINISSGAGHRKNWRDVHSLSYHVSKFAVEGFTKALSVQMNFPAAELRGITTLRCTGYAAQLRFAAPPCDAAPWGLCPLGPPESGCHSSPQQSWGVFWHILIKRYNIAVNAFSPGATDTQLIRSSLGESKDLQKPEEVVRAILFLATQSADTMTGESVDARYYRFTNEVILLPEETKFKLD